MGEIIVTLENAEQRYGYEDYGISFESTSQEIIDAVKGSILEEFGINIDEGNFKVNKVESSGNTFIFPASVAG